MKRTIILLLSALILSATGAVAQVAINTDGSAADGSAILDLKSSDKGLLIPRVTLNDVSTADPVTNPATGLLIYNIDGTEAAGVYCWDGIKWLQINVNEQCSIYGNPSIVAKGNNISTTVGVCEGASLILSSADNGNWDASTPTYSWTGPNSFTSSSAIPGEVTASFSAATHAGDYTVTITNGVARGCSYSSTITVTSGTGSAPVINTQPENLSLNNTTNSGDFTVSATDATNYQWQEDHGSGFADISNGGVYSGATTATLSISSGTGMDGYEYRCVISNNCDVINSNSATLNWADVSTVVSGGQTWMDRNLGASQVATASDDADAYGDLYQWGRATEGHEKRTSQTTSILANTSAPNQGNDWDGLFIPNSSSSPYNWMNTTDNNLWQGVSGTNNPCPDGFRVPTKSEWENERTSWSSGNREGAFSSPCKFTVTGQRYPNDGTLKYAGTAGYYWASTLYSVYADFINISVNSATMQYQSRSAGFTVRCIQDY